MKKYKWILGGTVSIVGLILVFVSRNAAIAENAATTQKVPFVVGLILTLLGLLMTISSLLPKRRPLNIHTLTMAAMLAALCYIGFAFFQFKI